MNAKRPEWLKVRYKESPNRKFVEQTINNLSLNTVCAEANCPNYIECFNRKTATFMILGTNCTRNCQFCNVATGVPDPVDYNEPKNVANAVIELGLKYVVITSVTRDDLDDGGATHFAKVIQEIKKINPSINIEVLIPDFKGDIKSLQTVVDATPAVIGHNIETIPRLYKTVLPNSMYERSLNVIENIKQLNPNIKSKTGLMLGLGEKKEEVLEVFEDLRNIDCDILTLGQYFSPSKNHYPLVEYIHPKQFNEYKQIALDMGFSFVVAAPFVRSSFHADETIKIL